MPQVVVLYRENCRFDYFNESEINNWIVGFSYSITHIHASGCLTKTSNATGRKYEIHWTRMTMTTSFTLVLNSQPQQGMCIIRDSGLRELDVIWLVATSDLRWPYIFLIYFCATPSFRITVIGPTTTNHHVMGHVPSTAITFQVCVCESHELENNRDLSIKWLTSVDFFQRFCVACQNLFNMCVGKHEFTRGDVCHCHSSSTSILPRMNTT